MYSIRYIQICTKNYNIFCTTASSADKGDTGHDDIIVDISDKESSVEPIAFPTELKTPSPIHLFGQSLNCNGVETFRTTNHYFQSLQ